VVDSLEVNANSQRFLGLLVSPKRRSVVVVLVYFALAVVVMRGLLFVPGTIGLRNDWSIPPFPIQYQARMEQALVNWSPDYLGTPLTRRTDLLLTTVLWFFATVFNVGGPFFSKAIPVLAFTGAGFFSYRLLVYLDRQRPGAFAGGLLYMLSPLMFNLMVFGQHHFLVGYALYPLLVHLFLRSLAAARPLSLIIGTGVVFAFSLSQDTFLAIGGATLLAVAIGDAVARWHAQGMRRLWRNLLLLVGVTALALLFHAPTVLSITAHARAARQALQLLSVAWNTWLAPEIIDALTLEGSGIRSFLDAVTVNRKAWWMLTNTAVIVLAFSAVRLPRKRRLMLALAATALFTMFIFKGVHAPLGGVNQWIFTHVPGMIAFRNLQYVTVFSNLILAVLLAHVVNHWRGVAATARTVRQRTAWRFAYVGLLLVLLLKAGPFFTGDFNRGVQVYQLGKEHEEIYTRQYRDPDDYRVLWLPPVQPMTYKSTPHAGLDPFGSQSPKPSIIDNPVQAVNWLVNMVLYTRPEANLGELLRKLAVRYVIYRDDLVSRTPLFQWGEFPKDEWTNDQLKRWLAGQSSLTLAETYGQEAINVYRHTASRGRLAAVGSANLSTGDLSDDVWLADYWPTDRNGTRDTIFTRSDLARKPTVLADTVQRVTIVNNNRFDLTALWLGSSAREFSITNLARDTKDGWAQNWPWKDWRYAAMLDPAVYTVRAYETAIPFTSEAINHASLWVKTYQSAKGASLKFALDGQPLKTVSMAEEALQGLTWHEVPLGSLPAGAHELLVTSGEGENVLARMIVVPQEAVAKAEQRVDEFLQNRELYLSLNMDFRDTPPYTSVPSRKTRTDALFTDVDLPLEVPAAGTYDIALHASGGAYLSQEQRESDSYQTIERGKTVGQTFTVSLTDSRIERVQVSAEARTLKNNTPAPVMPDAPLRAKLFRVENKENVLVGESTISPSAAGINDAWKLVDADFSVAIERAGNPFPEYFVEFSTDATDVVWAVRTVQNGFRGKPDYYEKGEMLVQGQPQPGDMVFTVLARSEDAKLDALAVDGTPLPSENFTLPWQNRTVLTLAQGTHTVSLRGVRSHTASVQLMMRRQGSVARPSDPPLSVRSHGITRFTTDTIRASSPYLVVFAESFDPFWNVEVKTGDGRTRVVPAESHVVVNGYANGWLVHETRPHTLHIGYAPQRAYQIGLYITGGVALLVGGFLGVQGIRSLRRRRQRWLATKRHETP